MRPSAPPASALLVVFLAGAGAAMAVAIGACTSTDSQSPTCTPDVDSTGIHRGASTAASMSLCAPGCNAA